MVSREDVRLTVAYGLHGRCFFDRVTPWNLQQKQTVDIANLFGTDRARRAENFDYSNKLYCESILVVY